MVDLVTSASINATEVKSWTMKCKLSHTLYTESYRFCTRRKWIISRKVNQKSHWESLVLMIRLSCCSSLLASLMTQLWVVSETTISPFSASSCSRWWWRWWLENGYGNMEKDASVFIKHPWPRFELAHDFSPALLGCGFVCCGVTKEATRGAHICEATGKKAI
jgi:hypothetical protein